MEHLVANQPECCVCQGFEQPVYEHCHHDDDGEGGGCKEDWVWSMVSVLLIYVCVVRSALIEQRPQNRGPLS